MSLGLDGTHDQQRSPRDERASTAAQYQLVSSLTDRDSKDVVDVIYADVKALNTETAVCNLRCVG